MNTLHKNVDIFFPYGSSINDLTVIGGGGIMVYFTMIVQEPFNKMRDNGGRGCQIICQKLRDVIYGRPTLVFCIFNFT